MIYLALLAGFIWGLLGGMWYWDKKLSQKQQKINDFITSQLADIERKVKLGLETSTKNFWDNVDAAYQQTKDNESAELEADGLIKIEQ